ncbi:MAG TPA: hypothetical protein ENN63_00735 [Bacteroidetes bacterium]|nr:hypothetical protein [Bacteroidota bacterium]
MEIKKHLFLTAASKRIILAVGILAFNIPAARPAKDDTTSTRQVPVLIRHEAFTVNALVQTGFRFSLRKDNFQGGRTFQVYNARLSFHGTMDDKFDYRISFNTTPSPALLDAYLSYRTSDAFRLTAGIQKPVQTLDYIPDPGSTDFITRARITGLLVQSRELGISAEGKTGGLYYYGGIFNGNRQLLNNNHAFYAIGRLQYTLNPGEYGDLQLAIQGSHGNSPGVRSGSNGPLLRGKRTLFGGDIKMETFRLLVAAEYLAGRVEIEEVPGTAEFISGYYFTGGYRVSENNVFLTRWQSWGYREMNFRDYQLTLGMNHAFSEFTGFQFNFDLYTPDTGNIHSGFSLLFQLQF